MKTATSILLSLAMVIAARADLETALSADAFVDAIGINIGPVNEVPSTSPYANIANVTASIKDLGIRHIRVMPIPNTKEIRNFVSIARGAGAKLDFMIGRSNTGQWAIDTKRNVIAAANSLVLRKNYLIPYLSSLEFIEGPNESLCHHATFRCLNGETVQHPSGTITFQNSLSKTLRSPASSYDDSPPIALPLLGPSGCMSNVSAAELKGCELDIENIHSYADNGYCPDWGITYGARYPGSYDYIRNADAIKGNESALPIIISETGYNTGSRPDKGIQLPVSVLAQAKYYPRLFASALSVQRIKKIYTWELYDASNAGNANDSFGLVAWESDGKREVKKPAYYAEKNLIGLLIEPGVSFLPSKLDFDLTAPASVKHLLLEKSSHEFYLLLWQEAAVYEYSNGRGHDVPNPDVNVTINLQKACSSAEQFKYDSQWSLVGQKVPPGAQLKVLVPDTVTVVKIAGLQ